MPLAPDAAAYPAASAAIAGLNPTPARTGILFSLHRASSARPRGAPLARANTARPFPRARRRSAPDRMRQAAARKIFAQPVQVEREIRLERCHRKRDHAGKTVAKILRIQRLPFQTRASGQCPSCGRTQQHQVDPLCTAGGPCHVAVSPSRQHAAFQPGSTRFRISASSSRLRYLQFLYRSRPRAS